MVQYVIHAASSVFWIFASVDISVMVETSLDLDLFPVLVSVSYHVQSLCGLGLGTSESRHLEHNTG